MRDPEKPSIAAPISSCTVRQRSARGWPVNRRVHLRVEWYSIETSRSEGTAMCAGCREIALRVIGRGP